MSQCEQRLEAKCGASSWMFNNYTDGGVREAYEKLQVRRVKMIDRDQREQLPSQIFFEKRYGASV